MKKWVRFIAVLVFIFSCLGFVPQVQAINLSNISLQSASVLGAERINPADAKLETEYGKKIDLNNANVRKFRRIPGFYPTLASKILQNAPYQTVEDVLEIPGLSDRQKDLLQANIEKFTVTTPAEVYNEGDDRYNPGVY